MGGIDVKKDGTLVEVPNCGLCGGSGRTLRKVCVTCYGTGRRFKTGSSIDGERKTEESISSEINSGDGITCGTVGSDLCMRSVEGRISVQGDQISNFGNGDEGSNRTELVLQRESTQVSQQLECNEILAVEKPILQTVEATTSDSDRMSKAFGFIQYTGHMHDVRGVRVYYSNLYKAWFTLETILNAYQQYGVK